MPRQPKEFIFPDPKAAELVQVLDRFFRYIRTDINELQTGATGTFTSADGKTVTVTNGKITAITS